MLARIFTTGREVDSGSVNMARVFIVLCAFICGITSASKVDSSARQLNLALDSSGHGSRNTRATEQWLDVVEEYAYGAMRAERARHPRSWTPKAFRLDLPNSLARRGDGDEDTVPVLVVPVPIPGRCKPRYRYREYDDDEDDDYYLPPRRSRPRLDPRIPEFSRKPDSSRYETPQKEYSEETFPRFTSPKPQITPQPERPTYDDRPLKRPIPTPFEKKFEVSEINRLDDEMPQIKRIVSSDFLIREFRSRQPSSPSLPPMVFSPVTPSPAPAALPPPSPAPAPPVPQWPQYMTIRAEVQSPKADYTEPYVMWWDNVSGASRVEFHGGTTTTVVSPQTDGFYRLIEVRQDNSEGRQRICGETPPTALSDVDKRPPALPDITQFTFAGYAEDTEVWQRTVSDYTGGANGETLVYQHSVRLRRTGNFAIPILYTVSVDSSVLGERCDQYTHRYFDVDLRPVPDSMFQVDTDSPSVCSQKEQLDPQRAEHLARVLPLREFTLPSRDMRYVELFDRYKNEFQRSYVDDKEAAVRMNLFIQSSRFVLSGNRQGATTELGTNFLGDRLGGELNALLGVQEDIENMEAEKFPHDEGEVRKLERQLPETFDWRDEGGVSHVRYQGSCSSCWAIAVSGAVEGALFRITRKLVPLAEQTLVDCAQPFGGNGCNGTWPSHAYDYVQQRALPALADYGAHKEKVERCRENEVSPVTQISAHVNVTKNNPTALKIAIKEHAPNVVVIDATCKSFIFYKKGVLVDDRCAKNRPKLNHAVLAVGYGKDFFTIKNSWSAAWGESGYARLGADSNTCGVLSIPSYPRVERNDVKKLP